MKTHKIILVFLLYGAIALSQNRQEDLRTKLDSMRTEILIPKLREYVQQVEKFESQMSHTTQKDHLKQYAREIVQVSNTMENQVAALYNSSDYQGGNFYFGAGMGPWGVYPSMVMMGYPGNFYYTNLPPVYYDIDRVKHLANNMRLFTWPGNVRRKETFIQQKLDILKSEAGTKGYPVSVK
jgi:hypothetical protein